ncbi:hypothetical protein GUITHDRAFT_108651 [Guillardia theta CCMP2712]|uniref:Uncharacterized protein n=1 Tax=Guillardia theta (strain CCMP2712) TaxID=905079 RepID=L1JA18_GUITC|nr:hypothetical protein GUITHDRAFT_108651 [Guillardia theta CCMP2712]EKX45383.1 hypothetical protein GUITHDRAFT_108651 [Guillardia theta CCMP2712]|eukprot:XP_005832363.1 hypothetical protein GUITHDRAFT_108651 [Guillardia theta CCMP2712]
MELMMEMMAIEMAMGTPTIKTAIMTVSCRSHQILEIDDDDASVGDDEVDRAIREKNEEIRKRDELVQLLRFIGSENILKEQDLLKVLAEDDVGGYYHYDLSNKIVAYLKKRPVDLAALVQINWKVK